ncbi:MULTISPECIES: helix-turn-helix domain-containing protein [Providencia]|uniref:HTH cro/C1-type domain-containing protein n=1 Tax=Providencia rettgeri TaxID=587 RepID=A0A379FT86_PRORE|nr:MULTISPECIES: helix-turn-helix transcriptional regulator [Providencia]EJF7713697.1 helix-turn-helix transcriptional regulator [Providencia rettgeri]MCX9108146.1 helix-turn-helix domain-containing protein [Providencia rettgeri]MCX9117500.1 helix-turn-helix domain-containing protein [Providencia rettgeri]MDH2366117.1 helix-turn-helix transcriptional regulator [Providencia rettgeri]QXB04669.1 helix-turn-helix domain-containing protein [Providencia rettgeri]
MKTESTVSTLIGKKIKILRRNTGYTASGFARLSGCKSDQQLYRYERSVNKIDTNMLVSVLRTLNINTSSFF